MWRNIFGRKTVTILALFTVLMTIGFGALTSVFATNPVAKNNVMATQKQQEKQYPSYVGTIPVSENQNQNLTEAQEAKMLQSLAKITPDQAKNAALAKVNGTVINIHLDNENGYLVYSVVIKSSNGITYDVKVDAGSAAVLFIEKGVDSGHVGIENAEAGFQEVKNTGFED